MIFHSDEARHLYYKSPTLLQVVCQMVESELMQHHLQLELVDSVEDKPFWKAILVAGKNDFAIDDIAQDILCLSIDKVNSRFQRYDGKPTIMVESGKYGLVTVQVTTPRDFKELQ